jgi:hypothetical protein
MLNGHSHRRWDQRYAFFNLFVTVRAKEDALVEFSREFIPAAVVASSDVESLGSRIDVMKVQGSKAAGIAADLATASFVRDQLSLQSSSLGGIGLDT